MVSDTHSPPASCFILNRSSSLNALPIWVIITLQVVAISTKLASMQQAGKKEYLSAPYRISKAAENMLMRCWARDPAAQGVSNSPYIVYTSYVQVTGEYI